MDDFVFDYPEPSSPNQQQQPMKIIHVRNAPSPAATSSLAIAEEIVNQADVHFGLLNSNRK